MCTVTFIASSNGCFITSNRDEKHWRKQALLPQGYMHGDVLLTYPKDADAGGTWIAVKENGDAAVLLNGAFISHTPAPPYRKSRGIIFLDIFSTGQPFDSFWDTTLHNIEPFTLVLYISGNLYECRWDGQKKHSRVLDNTMPHIWSSATLYDKETVQKREDWFNQWLAENPLPEQQDILDFHRFGGDGDTHNDLHMNRDGKLLTVSITGIKLTKNKATMRYLDLQSNQSYTKQIAITNSLAII